MLNCFLWRTGDTKNLKSGGIGRQSVELIPAAYRFCHLNETEFRNATLTTDRLHGCSEYDYDITFILIHFLIFSFLQFLMFIFEAKSVIYRSQRYQWSLI